VSYAWRTNRVDVAPVGLLLRVLLRVAVHLGCRGEQDTRTQALGKSQHVDCAYRGSLDGLDRIVLCHAVTRMNEVHMTSGDEVHMTSGDEVYMTSGDEVHITSGDEVHMTSGDEVYMTSGDEVYMTSGDEVFIHRTVHVTLHEILHSCVILNRLCDI
jgi:hypothetical protein